MRIYALFGQTAFLKAFHGYATLVWFIISFPLAYLYGSSVVFVTFLSLYAIVTGHWSAWQSTRTEMKQEEQLAQTDGHGP